MRNIPAEERMALKGRGIILNRDKETFSVRVITEDGTLTAQQLEAVAEAARRFGNGSAAMTARMTVELQCITYENIGPMEEFLAQHGLYSGGTGPRVRPIVPCKGTVCVHGLVDTQALARELHEKFYKGWYDVKLPHKFKIGVGGCPNNCIKPGLNDFGVIGQRVPRYDPEKCRSCKTCGVVTTCPMRICAQDGEGKLAYQDALCNNCGKCIDACPFHAFEEEAVGYRILLGGIWGKRQRLATPLDGVYTKDEMIRILEKSLTIWKEQGVAGERFGLFLERIGVERFAALLEESK